MQQAAFALFDFDKTLSRGDSVLPFLFYCIGRGEAPWYQAFKALGGYLDQKLHPERIALAKEKTLSFLAGRTRDEVDALARDFFRDRLKKRLYPQGLTELGRLKKEGYRILIVSASASAYMEVLSEFLPVDGVISTVCGLDEDGRYNGRVGENCKGVQKPLRIAEYLAANHSMLNYETSCAYGDSASDAPMLSLVREKVLVNPAAGLRRAVPDGKVVHWG